MVYNDEEPNFKRIKFVEIKARNIYFNLWAEILMKMILGGKIKHKETKIKVLK